MSKKAIITGLIFIIIAGLLYTAHTVNLIETIKRLHGG